MGMNRLKPSVLMVVLAGLLPSACVGQTPAGPTASSSPVASASPSASAAPSATPSAQTSTPASATPGVAVETTTMRGTVYDERQNPVPDGSTVKVHSLDTSRPFDTTVETRGGKYVVNEAPVGAALQITANRMGWTRRTRVEVLRTNNTNLERRNMFNFGGAYDENDPSGLSYFISDYPEVESVEPADEATSNPSDKMVFKMVLSEPLDTANQRRFASAFVIVPNNEEALADDSALPEETATSAELSGLRAGADPLTTSAYRYRQNSGFLNGFQTSDFKWDADNRTATFTLAAPVKTGDQDEGEYAFLLVQQDDNVIEDGSGKPLGMNENGEFGRTVQGGIIYNAVRETEVSLIQNLDKDTERWADTHMTYTTYRVSTDTVAPKLVGVTARRNYVDDSTGVATDRIEMTFSEPMIAYPRISGSQLLSLNNYIITAADTQADVDARKLSDDGTAADIAAGATFSEARTAIEGATGGVIGANGATTNNHYAIAISVKDPKVVILDMPSGALPLTANFVKVYVGSDNNALAAAKKSVTDPAGNVVDANQRTATGPIN